MIQHVGSPFSKQLICLEDVPRLLQAHIAEGDFKRN